MRYTGMPRSRQSRISPALPNDSSSGCAFTIISRCLLAINEPQFTRLERTAWMQRKHSPFSDVLCCGEQCSQLSTPTQLPWCEPLAAGFLCAASIGFISPRKDRGMRPVAPDILRWFCFEQPSPVRYDLARSGVQSPGLEHLDLSFESVNVEPGRGRQPGRPAGAPRRPLRRQRRSRKR